MGGSHGDPPHGTPNDGTKGLRGLGLRKGEVLPAGGKGWSEEKEERF